MSNMKRKQSVMGANRELDTAPWIPERTDTVNQVRRGFAGMIRTKTSGNARVRHITRNIPWNGARLYQLPPAAIVAFFDGAGMDSLLARAVVFDLENRMRDRQGGRAGEKLRGEVLATRIGQQEALRKYRFRQFSVLAIIMAGAAVAAHELEACITAGVWAAILALAATWTYITKRYPTG